MSTTKVLAVFALLFALVACSKSSSTVTASPTADASKALGCDFHVPTAPKNRELTESLISETVAAAPAAIRADLRVVYEATKKYADDVKAAQTAPQAERPQRLQAASKDIDNETYRAAAARLRTYFVQHCTGLRRQAPTATP